MHTHLFKTLGEQTIYDLVEQILKNLLKIWSMLHIKNLRTSMDKIAKFEGSILKNESLIKKKVEYGSKIAKIE